MHLKCLIFEPNCILIDYKSSVHPALVRIQPRVVVSHIVWEFEYF